MELTSFLKKIKGQTEQEPKLFLAVQIDDEFVKTAIWTVKDEATSLAAVGSTQDWDGSSTEILIEAVDASLVAGGKKLGPDTQEPDRVIFGLPENWVGSDGISPPRLKDLKQICQKLELEPVGFVVTTEAISHYLKSKEGTPLSAILIRVSTSEITVSIVRLGNIEGTHVVGRSDDLAGDVREGLARFGDQESLPARMVVYDGDEDSMEDLTQQLLAYDWQSYLPFLHMPHIESVSETFSITAIAVAGGSEVAKSLGFAISRIASAETETRPEKPQPQAEEEPAEPAVPTVETAVGHESAAAPFPASLKLVFSRLFSRLKSQLPPRLLNKIAAAAAIGIFSTVFGLITAAKRLPKANLELVFESQTLNQKVRVKVDPAASVVDPENAVLPASPVTVIKSGQKTAPATGKKTIGDKAKGEVTIYNRRTDGGKTFAVGTVISAENKEFVLDADIQVASASADADYSIVPGKSKVSVTARSFGSEFNLAAGTEFQVNTFSKSTYVAKNDSGLIGGTKQEVKAVSGKDLSDLKKTLLEELKSAAAQEIESEKSDLQVFPATTAAGAENEKYSAAAGEEIESVSLELTAKITALAVEKQNLENLLSALLRDTIPQGFTLAVEDLNIDIENVTPEGDAVSFDAKVSAKLSPTVERSQIIKMALGKRPADALKQIESLPHIRRADLTISPKLPSFFQWLPADENRLNLSIKLED